MAAWNTVAPSFVGHQAIDVNSAEQKHELGTCIDAKHDSYGVGKFIYLKGVASTAVGSWVTFNQDDHSTALLAANAIGPVAVAMAPTVAGEFGWYQVYGKAVGKAGASFADNGLVYATGTDGTVDDAVVAGDRVKRAKGASDLDVPGTGLAEFEIHHPFMDDGSAT
jgi:hypothetical protein